jgi:hypothetical protein
MLTIVIGPLEIMLGTINNTSGFGSWFKKMLSYLAVYPVLALLFFLSFFFLNQGIPNNPSAIVTHTPFQPYSNIITSNSWSPPFSILANGSSQQLIWVLVSFVIFGQITKVVEMIQAFIAGKPWAYGTAIGEAVNGAVGYAKKGGYIVGTEMERAGKDTVWPWGGKVKNPTKTEAQGKILQRLTH